MENPRLRAGGNAPRRGRLLGRCAGLCAWLSNKERKTYRLPTEAEWEYAARAGSTSRSYNGDDPEKLTEIANVADASAAKTFPAWRTVRSSDGWVYTSPVGKFRPNQFGLYDMLGNVSEWCADWHDKNYAKGPPENDPTGPPTGTAHIARGGSFDGIPTLTSRSNYAKVHHGPDRGFRVLCEIKADTGNKEDRVVASVPAASASKSTGDARRRYWEGTGTSFQDTEYRKKWREVQRNQHTIDFDEVTRTPQYVEIIDPRRDLRVRLTNRAAQWKIKGQNKNWATFQSGGWAASPSKGD